MQCGSALATCRFCDIGWEQRLYVLRDKARGNDAKEVAQTLILDCRERVTWRMYGDGGIQSIP
jgi:hypothetical protein